MFLSVLNEISGENERGFERSSVVLKFNVEGKINHLDICVFLGRERMK